MELLKGIINGERESLSKAITLVESSLDKDKIEAEILIQKISHLPSKSLRIGITGVPGVGKSTFIECFGRFLLKMNKKVAVLAIDPTSMANYGSILGDKSRMHQLSKEKNAFIRPSPTSGTLGGVAEATNSSIKICEAAGYDIILIETVGVGQNEFMVGKLVDIVIVLMLSNAGDELQGIKRGIMEHADIIAINKSDGDNIQNSKNAMNLYSNSLSMFPIRNNWSKKVICCSALESSGIDELWKLVENYVKIMTQNKFIKLNRASQQIFWLHKKIKEELGLKKYNILKNNNSIEKIETDVLEKNISLEKILNNFI